MNSQIRIKNYLILIAFLLGLSVGCNKNFTGNAALDTTEKIKHWLGELCAEVAERLEIDRETVKYNLIVAFPSVSYPFNNFFSIIE